MHISQYTSMLSDLKIEKNIGINIKYIQNFAINNIHQDASLGKLAYNCELLSKSLLLNSSNRMEKAILNRGDQDIIELLQEMKSAKEFLMKAKAYINVLEYDTAYISAKKAIDNGKHHYLSEDIKQLEKKKEEISILGKKTDEWSETISLLTHMHSPNQLDFTTTWEDIRDELYYEAAIEFVVHSGTESKNELDSALLIRSNSEYPQVIPLTDSKSLLKALQDSDFEKLYQLIWLLLKKYTAGYQRYTGANSLSKSYNIFS